MSCFAPKGQCVNHGACNMADRCIHTTAPDKGIVPVRQAIRGILVKAIDNLDPEYRNVESFVQFMKDEERDEYSHEELMALNFRTRTRIQDLCKVLEARGLRLANRPFEKKVRGFNSNNNDRWYGPGACRTHGGAGIEPTTGRANAKGTV